MVHSLLIKASFGVAMQDATWVAVGACWLGALIAIIGLRPTRISTHTDARDSGDTDDAVPTAGRRFET